MEQNKFDEFWETDFFPFAKVLCEKFSNLRFDASKKDRIYLKYEGSRQRLRNYMLDPSGRMDRHKVASLLMAAILQIQPFQSGIAFNLQEIRIATIEYMPNEVWAWICALRAVRSFLLARAEQDGDEQSYQMFQAYDCFYFPFVCMAITRNMSCEVCTTPASKTALIFFLFLTFCSLWKNTRNWPVSPPHCKSV